MNAALLMMSSAWMAGADTTAPLPPPAAPIVVSTGTGCGTPGCGTPAVTYSACTTCKPSCLDKIKAKFAGFGKKKSSCGCAAPSPCGCTSGCGGEVGGCSTPLPYGAAPIVTPPMGTVPPTAMPKDMPKEMPKPVTPPVTPKPGAVVSPITPISGPPIGTSPY